MGLDKLIVGKRAILFFCRKNTSKVLYPLKISFFCGSMNAKMQVVNCVKIVVGI